MKSFGTILALLGIVAWCAGQDSTWSLVWSDEFNGNALDTASWTYDVGTGDQGWGNGELQFYTPGDNLSFNDSCLVIELRRQLMGSAQYTSSRITTRQKIELQYGKIQVRLKAPYSQAVWPAVWTLGSDFNPPYNTPWPACGEIDIFEMACGENYTDDRGDNSNFAVVHYTDLADFPNELKKSIQVPGRMADQFHVFTLIWDEENLSFYLDSAATPYFQVDITPAYMSEFHQPHSLTIDLALGGVGFAGNPDASTVLPQYLTVDWIRWYQKKTNVQNGFAKPIAATPSMEKNASGLSFNIQEPANAFLRFFDLRGGLVADLSDWIRSQPAGRHTVAWERLPVRRGVYCISFSDGMHQSSGAITLTR
ncbi:MAG TPA: glycoside hydrolase family 16 protein [Chitinivibrionales bacterium]|nr:glycoside hydrolase family 16 protein [Chitinivibrionales bacterium]